VRTLRPSLVLTAGLATGALALATACAVDSGPLPSAADAGPVADATPAPDAAIPIDATPLCDDVQLNVLESGHHAIRYDYQNGSQGCLGNCHNGTGVGGPLFTAAGAIYDRRTDDGNGGPAGNPVAGAYVYVIDADGKVVPMLSAQNGFFWTSEPLRNPLRTYASGCPDSIPMVANATGNCNAGACHGEDNKIYVRPYSP
jgi:hypothetical protein